MSKVKKKVKHPENLRVKQALRYGDVVVLAKRSARYTYRTIHEILNGNRIMPDSLAQEITQLIKERKQIAKELEQETATRV